MAIYEVSLRGNAFQFSFYQYRVNLHLQWTGLNCSSWQECREALCQGARCDDEHYHSVLLTTMVKGISYTLVVKGKENCLKLKGLSLRVENCLKNCLLLEGEDPSLNTRSGNTYCACAVAYSFWGSAGCPGGSAGGNLIFVNKGEFPPILGEPSLNTQANIG